MRFRNFMNAESGLKSPEPFTANLIEWYRVNSRNLPWRKTKDPYYIWVSEVMLQQTQVNTVIPYYFKFLEQFPDIYSLARSPLEKVLKIWEGLGYYARARNLHKASKIVVLDNNGQVPDTIDQFKKLPGVGDYIGAAVQSIAFHAPLAVVDGNVKRVLARVNCLSQPINGSQAHKFFQPYAQKLIDPEDPATFNQAIMELGALICTPKNPKCLKCPVKEQCKVYQMGKTDQFPKRIKPKKTPLHKISVGIVRKGEKFLITQRKPEGLLGGLWEFPGGKIKIKETPQKACLREIKEETGIQAVVTDHLTTVRHVYTHFKIKMDVFCCDYISGRVNLNGPVDYRWVPLNELKEFAFPKANLKFIPLIPEPVI